MRLVRLLERRDLVTSERHIGGRDCLFEMTNFGCPNDRSADSRSLQDPCARDLRGCDAPFLRDLLDQAQYFEVVLAKVHVLREVIGLCARGRAAAAFIAIASKESASQRTPRHQADAVVDAQRIHLALFLAIDQVVMVLHRDKPMPSVFLLDAERLGELPRRHRTRAEITHLAGADQRIERLQRFFYRRGVVPSMDLVEVDEIHLEPAERRVAGFEDMLAAEAAAILPRRHRRVHFGRDHELVALRHLTEPAPGDLLADAGRVNIGGVEELDSRLEPARESLTPFFPPEPPIPPVLFTL